LHEALAFLGVFTIFSTIIFRKLKKDDGNKVSQQKAMHAE
jgi:hypothetical protein